MADLSSMDSSDVRVRLRPKTTLFGPVPAYWVPPSRYLRVVALIAKKTDRNGIV